MDMIIKGLTPMLTKYKDATLSPIALKILRSFLTSEEGFLACKKVIYNIFMSDVYLDKSR